MKILHLCPGQDTGGQAIATKRAFDALAPDWEMRVITASRTYLGFDADMAWNPENVATWYAWADLVVIHRHPEIYERVDHGQRKPIVIHHHGTQLRNDAERVWMAGAAFGAVQVVSTVDLLLSIPDGQSGSWLPQVHDLDAYAAMAAELRPNDGKIRIAHAPTDRQVKDTDAVEAAVRSLARKYPVELVLIERQSWQECLARKATADILVDQFQLGYGNNAIEGWGLGTPVVAGASEPILARMRAEYRTRTLPFVEATPETLEATLERLIVDPKARAAAARRGLRHARKYHSQEAIVRRLQTLYPTVPATVGGPTEAERHQSEMVAKLEHRHRLTLGMRRRLERRLRAQGLVA